MTTRWKRFSAYWIPSSNHNNKLRTIRFIFFILIAIVAGAFQTNAQDADSLHAMDSTTLAERRAMMEFVTDEPSEVSSEVSGAKADSSVSKSKKEKKLRVPKAAFVPDPKRATWYSIVCPGLGQIYNRSYWKLPIVYGGMIACTYLISWNGRMYNDYRNAYHDIIDDDPRTNSYLSLYPSYDGSQSWLSGTLKSKTNNYRRTRDMSVFAIVMLYMVTAVDAFVDAHLYDFTVSDDLSLKIEPVINGYGGGEVFKSRSFGMQCSITF